MGIDSGDQNRSRLIQIIGVILIGITLLVFYVLALVGCISTSPSIPDIYLVQLQNTKFDATVRVGYFGMCAMLPANLTCVPTFMTTANSSIPLYSTDARLEQLIRLGHDIQRQIIVFVPLVIGGLLYFSAVVALFWYIYFARARASAGAAWSATVYLTTYSVAGAVGAASAVTMASSALRFAGTALADGGEIVATGGSALQVLQWMIVGLTLVWHILIPRLWSPRR